MDHHFLLGGAKVLWRYTRLRGSAAGWSYLQDAQHPRVLIDLTLRGRALLETEIHEAFHHLCPDHSEEHVTSAARDLARILWALGYRRTSKEKPDG